MNAAKALLTINGPTSLSLNNIRHGISFDSKKWLTNNIKDVEVLFQENGVLFELSKYFSEEAVKKNYKVYDLLYNIPCVHRAFSITYNSPELFIPIRDIGFIVDTDTKKGWVQFQVDERYANGNSLRFAPTAYEKVDDDKETRYLMRAKADFDWDIHGDKKERFDALSEYHGIVRKDLLYIYGDTRLWYLKKRIASNQHIVERNSITLIFAVMHWLSELVRYNPMKFSQMMKSKQNWLIHEFIDNALYQFVDELSCEITKADIMTNGYRK